MSRCSEFSESLSQAELHAVSGGICNLQTSLSSSCELYLKALPHNLVHLADLSISLKVTPPRCGMFPPVLFPRPKINDLNLKPSDNPWEYPYPCKAEPGLDPAKSGPGEANYHPRNPPMYRICTTDVPSRRNCRALELVFVFGEDNWITISARLPLVCSFQVHIRLAPRYTHHLTFANYQPLITLANAAMVRHVVAPIVDSDWEEFVQVKFRSFSQEEFCYLVNGSDTAENRERCKNKYTSPDWACSGAVCLKVVDEDARHSDDNPASEKILGAAIYSINPTYSVDLSKRAVLDPNTMVWLDDPEDRKISTAVLHDVMDRKSRFINEPHIQLDTLFVDPEHQRKGIATLLVNWGIQRSQQMMLPLWLEASETGSNLYPKLGFKEVIRTRLLMGKWDIKYSLFRLEPPQIVSDAQG